LTNRPTQTILLFKDKDGIYEYDPIKKNEKIIYKATDNQVFLDEAYKIINDTLTFGLKGELTYSDSINYSAGEIYFKDYISVSLESGNNWLAQKILYQVLDHKLKIITQTFNSKGDMSSQSDTTLLFKSSSSSYKGITYNQFEPRFFSKSTVGNKTVFSLRGRIFLVEKLDTTILVEYQGNFDPKFGSGYFQPQLDPRGEFAVFRYLPGFMNFKESPYLLQIDLITHNVTKIKKGIFGNPTFSKDGQFLLFNRNQRQGNKNTWISDILILEFKTKKEWKIGESYTASWKD
jgi:hypothetical protein